MRFSTLKEASRVRLLSLIGFAILIGLCGSALAVSFAPSPPGDLLDLPTYGPGVGYQSGDPLPTVAPTLSAPSGHTSAVPTASVSVSPSATTMSSAQPLSAGYKTIALLGLGGFDTEVTVRGTGSGFWSVILVMPANKKVENRSAGLVSMKQEGTKITVTPLANTQLPATFTVRFPAVLALGGKVSSCTIDGRPCKQE